MAHLRSSPPPLPSSQRCPACDADVLFLEVCPSCGLRVGPAESGSVAVPLSVAGAASTAGTTSPATSGNVVSFAEAARLRSKAQIPDQLSKVWGPARQPEEPRAASKSTDEWIGTTHELPRRREPGRRGLWIGAGLAAVVAAAAIGITLLSRHTQAPPASQSGGQTAGQTHPGRAASGGQSQAGQSQHHPAAVVPRFEAGGYPFAADLSGASVSHFRESLMGKPYRVTTYDATSAGTAVTVSVFPFPVGVAKMSGPAFLRLFADHVGLAPGVRSGHPARGSRVQGLPTMWLAATTDGGNQAAMAVLVLDGHVAYEVLATGPATSVATTFDHVVRTFRIVDPARGIVFV